ncbi:MAG: hypothetical protein LDL11_00420 [Desulfarculus sp.]|nr:hypothetical protein [Desulfarculus sp.]
MDLRQPAVDSKNYVWVIVELRGTSENFLGLEDRQGRTFVPVTADKDAALMLLGKLPAAGDGVQRQVEAIHRQRLGAIATEQGFAVDLVDAQGRVLERLAPA